MPRVLFIPDRFMDYRMWSDIPDRIRDRADAVHLDQHAAIPWPAADDGLLGAVRDLAAGARFDIVVGAGQAARIAFAIAEAGLAASMVLFYPVLDRMFDEVISAVGDIDAAEVLDPYQPIVNALHHGDAGQRRDVLLQVIRDTAGPDIEPDELERILGMFSDHAEELFAELQAAENATVAEQARPDPPWIERPWIDHLSDLTIPVTAVVTASSRAIGKVIATRAADAEIVVASSRTVPVAEPGKSAEVLLHMLGRLSDGETGGRHGQCGAVDGDAGNGTGEDGHGGLAEWNASRGGA